MKFLHVSDLHIGKRVNGMSMVEDQEHILAQILRSAVERGVDALVIAGDIYDKASPSAEAVTVFDAFLTHVAEAGIRVLAVPGNHDSAERIAYAQGLLAAQGVCFPPVFAGSACRVDLEDEYGAVAFWLLPFLKPGDVRRFFAEREIGDDYGAALRAVIESCEVDRTQRNVAISHQLVVSGGLSPERSSDEIQLGGIDAVDFGVYDDFDYVALGHVHRQQRVGRETVRYSGSPLKYSFSEARYSKHALLVELGPKVPGDEVGACASFELVDLAPLHDMREVRMALAELLALGQSKASCEVDASPADAGDDSSSFADVDAAGPDADMANGTQPSVEAGSLAASPAIDWASLPDKFDYLHVTLTDEHPQLDAMRKIHEVFPNAMTLDYDNAIILQVREHARAAVDPDKVNAADLFAQFYEEQVGKPLDDVQADIVAKAVRAAKS